MIARILMNCPICRMTSTVRTTDDMSEVIHKTDAGNCGFVVDKTICGGNRNIRHEKIELSDLEDGDEIELNLLLSYAELLEQSLENILDRIQELKNVRQTKKRA